MSDSPVTVFEYIVEARRSVYAYLQDEIPRAVIDGAIRLAILAPNHYRTRPWRFFVFSAGGRDKLADAYEGAAKRLGRDVLRARERAYVAPAMIAVACMPMVSMPKVKIVEEEFATIAAVQTLMLALASSGIGSLLTTGDFVESHEVRDVIGLDQASGRVIGVVCAGFADPTRTSARRGEDDMVSHTTWHT